MLLDVPYGRVAGLASVIHEQLEHLFRFVVHVKRTIAKLGEKHLHDGWIHLHEVLVVPHRIVRTFLHPYHGITIQGITNEV